MLTILQFEKDKLDDNGCHSTTVVIGVTKISLVIIIISFECNLVGKLT